MLLKVAACFVLLFAVVPAQSEEDICTLPADPGPCYAIIPNWFFNSQSGKCERFDYGGCGGNENNFETLTSCLAACGSCANLGVGCNSSRECCGKLTCCSPRPGEIPGACVVGQCFQKG